MQGLSNQGISMPQMAAAVQQLQQLQESQQLLQNSQSMASARDASNTTLQATKAAATQHPNSGQNLHSNSNSTSLSKVHQMVQQSIPHGLSSSKRVHSPSASSPRPLKYPTDQLAAFPNKSGMPSPPMRRVESFPNAY